MSDISFPTPEAVASVGPMQRSIRKEGLSYTMHPDLHNLFSAFYRFVPERPQQKDDKDAHKRAYLEALVRQWEQVGFNREIIAAVAGRQQARQQARPDVACEARQMTLQSRLVAGLGYDGPLEVGFSLHPLYGFPYLPGSSIKGLVRSYVREVVVAEERATPEDLHRLFGNPPEATAQDEQRGVLSFEDAVPAAGESLKLEVDVMTPHYSPYYTGDAGALPGDWHQPTPVPFLTVRAGSVFSFSVTAPGAADAQQAAVWMEEALARRGAGAKTRAGYGTFLSEKQRNELMALVHKFRGVESATEEAADETAQPAGLPPKKRRVGKNTTGVLARVLGPNESNNPEYKTDVELLVEGYEGIAIPMTGRYQPGLHAPGDLVEVDVMRYKKRKVTMVKRVRGYEP